MKLLREMVKRRIVSCALSRRFRFCLFGEHCRRLFSLVTRWHGDFKRRLGGQALHFGTLVSRYFYVVVLFV